MSLRLYIWEGNGISAAWHDDGTLVVLAESPEQARALAREAQRLNGIESRARQDAFNEARRESGGRLSEERRVAIVEAFPIQDRPTWDGTDDALDRDPDRVIEITGPAIVAFNGGGYD